MDQNHHPEQDPAQQSGNADDTDQPSTTSHHHEDDLEDDYSEHKKKRSSELWEWSKALAFAVLIAVVIRVFLFAPIVVDGESMMPTLSDEERLIVNKAVYYISEPERGEIVVFHATETKDWIKRVIGEPGDKIEVRNGDLYVNGDVVEEYYLDDEAQAMTQDFEEIVPEDHIFVMGDNRGNSQDSRNIGSVPLSAVIGRAEVVFWPYTDIRFMQSE